jgi:Polysaccharide lyase
VISPSNKVSATCRIALALPLALFLVFLAAGSASAAAVEIVAPTAIEAPEMVPYAVSASTRAEKIAFYVDGRRRWVASAGSGSFDRSGYLPTAGLGVGRHSLSVEMKRGGRVTKRSRTIYVTTRRKTGRGKPAPSPEPAPVPSPEEPAPLPAPEEPAPAPAPAPEPAPAPAPSPSLLFNSGFEGSFSGWYLQSLPERAKIVSGSAFRGSTNARFEVREGDVEPDTGSQRSEVSGPTFNEGEDIYVHDAFRIPSAASYQGSWQIIQQLHETSWSGSPGMAVFLSANHTLQIGAGDGSPTYWKSGQLQTDRWYELVYRVKLSQNANTGFVEVWLNGSPQTLLNGQTKSYGQTMQTSHVYLKAGIYRGKSSTGTSLIEHDAISVGSSLSAVSAS